MIIPERRPGISAISVVRGQSVNHGLLGQEIADGRFDDPWQFSAQALFDTVSQIANQLVT